MSTRIYPLYQKGNPQLRVFLPNFWMKVIKPAKENPPNQVTLMTSIEMTKYDVRNYLEKIYGINPVHVKVQIMQGRFRKNEQGYVVKDDDYKLAYVSLPKSETFTFPEVSPKGEDQMEKDLKDMEENKKSFREKMKQETYLRPGTKQSSPVSPLPTEKPRSVEINIFTLWGRRGHSGRHS